MEQPDKPILEYASPPPPPPPLLRRDSMEYYREPPPIANMGLGYVLVWVIGFVVVTFIALWGLARFFTHPPL